MPLLSRKRSNIRSNPPSVVQSPSNTQKTQDSIIDYKTLLSSANITKSNDLYTSPDVFESLCTLRSLIESENQAIQIMKSIESEINTEKELKYFLMPIKELKQSDEDVSLSSFSQDSVCRILMRISSMQLLIIKFILGKITEHSDEEIDSNSIISLLLKQLKWPDFINDCSTLVTGLFEISSHSVQVEIVNLLPEFVHDNHQEMCVKQLISFLQSESTLCPVILSTLENLRLTENQFIDNLPIFLNCCSSVPLSDLSSVIRFLLRVCPISFPIKANAEILNILTVIRKSCDPTKWKNNSSIGSSIFEELYSSIQQRPDLSKCYIKLLNTLPIEEIVPLDIWLMAILMKEELQTYQVERILTRRFYHFPAHSSVFKIAIENNGSALVSVYSSLLQMSESLAKSSSLVAQELAESIILACWNEFKHPYYQQEIISSLITQIGSSTVNYSSLSSSSLTTSSSGAEVSTSLSILQTLSSDPANTTELSNYTIFIRGILDFADKLSISQIYTLFSILCQLASSNSLDSNIINELFILIRKYLGMKDVNHRQMGILGCRALFHYYTQDEKSLENLFAFAVKSTRNYPDMRLFLYQQLTAGIESQSFSKEITVFIKDQMADILDKQYLLDFPVNSDDMPPICQGHIPYEVKYNLLGDKSVVCINILGKCAESSLRQKQAVFLLPTLLHLVVVAEQACDPKNWLTNVNAVIGCGLLSNEDDIILDELSSTERDIIMIVILAEIQWVKEIVNTYCCCNDELVQYEICQRLALLNTLNQEFNKIVPIFGIPFIPVGMEQVTKSRSKNTGIRNHNQNQNQIEMQPFSPSIIQFFSWPNLHIVRNDDVLRVIDVKDMKYTFMSLASLQLILNDIYSYTKQLQVNPISRTKKMEQKELLDILTKSITSQFLEALSILYVRCYETYMIAEQDLEGNDNDDEFRRKTVIPVIKTILLIFTSLFSNMGILDFMYANDIITKMKTICKGSDPMISKDFILNTHKEDKKDEVEGLYSIHQIAPMIKDYCEICLNNCKQCDDFDLNLITLEFVESMIFLQVNFYVCLKGERESIQIENKKQRDSQLINNETILNDSEVKELVHAFSETILVVLQRNAMGTKKSSSYLKSSLSFLLHNFIIYSQEPITKLIVLIENINTFNTNIYENKQVEEAAAVRETSQSFPSLTTDTFIYYFTCAFDELLRIIESLKIDEVVLVSDDACSTMLTTIKRIFTLLEVLVTITKKNDKQNVLVYTVKSFGQFMTFFLGKCWSFLKKLLIRFTSDVVMIVKIVQRCTRQIQSLCAHAKITKDASILTYVPKIKKQLEQMIYVIKETLKKEGAEDAFWMGNLKNRYLNGKEVTAEGDEELIERKKRKTKHKNKEGVLKKIKVEDEGAVAIDDEAAEVNDGDEEEEDKTEEETSSESSESSESNESKK